MKHGWYPEWEFQSLGPKGWKYILAWKQSPATLLQTHWADITAKWAGALRWLSNDNDPLGAGKETSLADDGVSFFSGKMGAIITLLVAMSYKWPLRSLQTRWRVAQMNSVWKTCAAQLYDSIIFFTFCCIIFFFFCLFFGINSFFIRAWIDRSILPLCDDLTYEWK